MRRLISTLLSACAVVTLVTAASAQPVSIGTATFIEWDIPATAGQPPAALEVVPTTAGGRNVYYLTEGSTQPPRVVRFTPGNPIGTASASWRSWAYGGATGPIAPTGGLKVRDNLVVFIRDTQAITRLNTNMNNRVRYLDGLGSRSDLAEDNNNVYTTGPSGTGGILQRLLAGSTSGTVTRWPVGGGAGSVYLSGVAVGPGAPGAKLVYFSQPTDNQIGQLNPATNNVRRWLLPPGVIQPRQLDLDAQGKVWVVAGSGHLVRLDPATNMVTPYLIPTPGSNPMGVGPNGLIGFTETGTNKVGMLIPDGAQVLVPPTNQTILPTTTGVPGVLATIPPIDGVAAPIMKTGPATSSGTAATGIFVEAQLPLAPPTPSTTPLAIEDDTVQSLTTPPGAFARAYFYSLGNPATNRIGRVELVRPAPEPTTLTLQPKTMTNPVGTQHCVTATVKDQYGEPMQGVNVEFRVTGSVTTASGEVTTNAAGQVTFCYTGPPFPGGDAIHAWADYDPNDDQQGVDEPFDDATKTWVFPVSTPGCEVKITNGGWIITDAGDRASFGGNAKVDAVGNVSGQEEYQDHGPAAPMNLHGNVLVVVCTSTTEATIYGQATIDGAGSFFYRIKVRDLAEPGKGMDTYELLVDNGYYSGDKKLEGGNVQIHKN
jgi:hypothetical protein